MMYTSAAPCCAGGQPDFRQKPNWLFRGLIIVSLSLHGLLCWYVAVVYSYKPPLTVIELSLRAESALDQRVIPRPRSRPQHRQPAVDKIEPVVTRPAPPSFKPFQVATLQGDLPHGIAESISNLSDTNVPGKQIEAWAPETMPDFSDTVFDSPDSYLELIRFRIEKNKLYPDQAKQKNMRGRVVVSLVITLNGEIGSVVIKKSSGHIMLDEAALSAVQRAVPLPVPPARFFKKDILLNIPILFEIT